jgi:hypothetical protein
MYVDLTEENECNKSYILSIDVGVRNLAVSVMELHSLEVVDCMLLDVTTRRKTANEISERIMHVVSKTILSKYPKTQIERVLIEQQVLLMPFASPYSLASTMNSIIECALHTAFRCFNVNVDAVVKKRTAGTSYYERKVAAVSELKMLMSGVKGIKLHSNVVEYLSNETKLDDLADSILQLRDYIKM